MRRRTIRNFDLLLLTNPVDRNSSQFRHALSIYEVLTNPPAIVIARETNAFRDHYLILDGNHRAVASAYLNRPIRVFELTGPKDIDKLIEIEGRGGFAPFPHRRFLMGQLDFTDLKRAAIWSAGFQAGFRTAEYYADQFLLEEARLPQMTSAELSPPVVAHSAMFISDDIKRWTALIRDRFIKLDPYRVFTCSVRELAEVCIENSDRGPELARILIAKQILEVVTPRGKPTPQVESNNEWRFKKGVIEGK